MALTHHTSLITHHSSLTHPLHHVTTGASSLAVWQSAACARPRTPEGSRVQRTALYGLPVG